MKTVARSLVLFLVMTLVTGFAYPLAVTGAAQVMFPKQANGSIAYRNRNPVGSELIGQGFDSPQYFHSRPSAAGKGYDATSSSGSNLGPTNEALMKSVAERADVVRKNNGVSAGDNAAPSDLVTASASGLDPHITPEAALFQVARVAKARQLPEETVRNLVEQHIEGRQLGILGEPRVNVLLLNEALDGR